ncbi:magnesium-translocating P-type ATPase [Thermoflavifilum thermophilum]|uniref:Magnesium-transporting ATPase, P-type 1 n=1 Tax=Thermoflavifilum thermophilum TaxID=1393122 RepID=A0A1I7NN79_9BACT|nr:magnesium-translocating P-type ATPase [Thermoflavifilum thermophilum]SFV36079.1 Mg2+-importing ATPase [Thermoflavifilum thermophilum]
MISIAQVFHRKVAVTGNKNHNGNQVNPEFPGAHRLQQIAALSGEEVYSALQSDETGLWQEEAEERLEQYGLNEITHDRAPAWYMQLMEAFMNPFVGVLAIIAIISFFTDVWFSPPGQRDYSTLAVILVMILVSSFLRFWQEYRSNRAAEALKSMVKTTATVLRKGLGRKEIPIQQLVPGDIIWLAAGDMLPADCRILTSKDLFITQAMLTGESVPVEKHAAPVADPQAVSVFELSNIAFMGTNVVSGSALAIVVVTGNQTYLGSLSRTLSRKRAETSFDRGVNNVSWLLIRAMMIMVPLVFLINGFTKGDWVNAFLFALAMAVGLTPEMLPMIVTTNLAKGAINMSRRKVIVKRLNAIQNIGAMDVLCTDKTGTLTLDKVVLERHLNVHGVDDDEVLKWAYLNSYHQTGLKNLLDLAVLEHAQEHALFREEEQYEKVDEIPFDFQRRRMSVIVKLPNQKHLLVCKGAVEEMIDLCSYTFQPDENRSLHIYRDPVIPLTKEMKENILRISCELNEDGLRVLLVAIREYEPRPLNYTVEDERDMVFTGFIGFLDPAKPSARPAIEALQKLGVQIKVLTGDNDVVARKICRDVGISTQHILLGADVEKMDDDTLKNHLKQASILAKLSPMQKARVVKLLQSMGHTVGFLGDGINDAAALKQADVGISVDTAVDIAKESADIILLEKDLMVLRKGVIYGRRTFGNIIKYIKMAVSSNFGNMFSMLGASAIFPFLPMMPVQLLVQNLLYDLSQISIPWDKMDAEYISIPRKWEAEGIARFMVFIGPISSIFDYVTFFVMYHIFHASTPAHQSLFQSGWFVEGLLSQTLIVHMIRTKKIPFIESWATWPVIALTIFIIAIGIWIPFSPFASALGLQPLPGVYFIYLILILASYCVLTQVVKTWYIRKFGQWL